MSVVDLGKVRGTQIYTGTGVTGTTPAGQIFSSSGITTAYEGDIYINTDNDSESKGNMYQCTTAGNQSTAKWGYVGNIRGPKADVINSLTSTATGEALSAYQGNRLYNFMKDAGIFAKKCVVECSETAYGIKITIDNVSTDIYLTVGTGRYKYSYVKSGTALRTTVTISIGAAIGLAVNGGIVSCIESSEAYIYAYELTGTYNTTLYKKSVELWDSLNEAMQSHQIEGEIVDDTDKIKYGSVYKILSGIKHVFYPITHAKAVWYDKSKGETVHDKMEQKLDLSGGKMSGPIVFEKSGEDTIIAKVKIDGKEYEIFRVYNANDVWRLIINDGMYTEKIGEVNVSAGEIVRLVTQAERIVLEQSSDTNYSANLRPYNDNKCTLGTAEKRFAGLWAGKSTIQTSDAREKENIVSLGISEAMTIPTDGDYTDIHSELFDRLRAVQYNFIKGDGRICYGLIAQEVLESMKELGIDENELDLVYHEYYVDEETKEEKDTYGIAYANLIALLIHEVQKLKSKVDTLEAEQHET